MFWVALALLFPQRDGARHAWFGITAGLTGLISITIVSGGFVAGLKAGKIYNTFPLMGSHWVPPGLTTLEPAWRNFTENATTVQFDHRLLAITTFLMIVAYWFRARKTDLPARAAKATNALLHTSVLQVALGISTLVFSVPLILAASHQAVAMLLFTVALILLHSLRTGPE
jgi:cytochrome c oxidase assembly protein subunit 15